MTVLLALLPETGHDQLWLLLAAERMGHHLDPYGPTVFESNPPLAIWLSVLVVAFAHLLHLSLTITFKLAVSLIAGASAFVSARLLRRLHPDLTRTKLWILGIIFILVFGAVPARDFGQRDHILILLVLPYLFAAAIDVGQQADRLSLFGRIAVTCVTALGLALKPQQALIAVAVETTLLLAAKPRRQRILEPAIFLIAGFSYIGAVRLFAPTYFTEVLPILRDTYWAIGHLTLPQLLLAAIQLLILATLALGAPSFSALSKRVWYGGQKHTTVLRPRDPVVTVLLAAGPAATLAYLLQGTGWYYQQLPAISLFALALTMQALGAPSPALDWTKGLDSETWDGIITKLPILTAALTILALALTTYFSDFHITSRGIEQPQPIPDPSFFADLPPNAAVATLTTSVDDTVPPAFRYHFILAQRYPHLWMLPAILRNQSGPAPRHAMPAARLAELDRLQHAFMVEDLTRWSPTLILVERCQNPAVQCQVLEDRHDDLLAFFLRDPAFAAIFVHYHFLRSAGPYDAYRRE